MYGKVFEDLFCSTLMDFGGDTAYVFIAMIVLSDETGVIKHTAESLARMICKDAESVKAAISHLERQDLQSNLKSHGGRRIVPLHEICADETRGWLIVNKVHYREKRDPKERRNYMREYMRKHRETKEVNSQLTPVNSSKPDLAHTHTDTDTDTKKKHIPPYSGAFLRFWGAWPKSSRKGSQGECWARWLKKDFDLVVEEIVSHVETLKRSADWQKDGGAFIPAPLAYLNKRRWEGAEEHVPSGEVI